MSLRIPTQPWGIANGKQEGALFMLEQRLVPKQAHMEPVLPGFKMPSQVHDQIHRSLAAPNQRSTAHVAPCGRLHGQLQARTWWEARAALLGSGGKEGRQIDSHIQTSAVRKWLHTDALDASPGLWPAGRAVFATHCAVFPRTASAIWLKCLHRPLHCFIIPLDGERVNLHSNYGSTTIRSSRT
jgi:hypothetical protein